MLRQESWLKSTEIQFSFIPTNPQLVNWSLSSLYSKRKKTYLIYMTWHKIWCNSFFYMVHNEDKEST